MSSTIGNYLFLGLEVIFCLGIIDLWTSEKQATNGETRWLKSLFEKDGEQTLLMRKACLAQALGHVGARGYGNPITIVAPHATPLMAWPLPQSSALRCSLRGDAPWQGEPRLGWGCESRLQPVRAGGVAGLSFLFL